MFVEGRVDEYIFVYRRARNFLLLFSVQITLVVVKIGRWVRHVEAGQPYSMDSRVGRAFGSLKNKIAKVVNYWISSILCGFIIEFAIDTSISYSKAE